MKFPTPLLLAMALALGPTTTAFAQQPAPGTEPHADGAPGAGTAHKKSSSKPAKASKQPEPGTEPHADGAPGAKPKQ